jgi:hypothetical protein
LDPQGAPLPPLTIMKGRLSLRPQIESLSEFSKAHKELLMLAGASLAAAPFMLGAKVSEIRFGQFKTEAETHLKACSRGPLVKAQLYTQVPGKGALGMGERSPRLVPVAG